jgi:hypothetical protein
MHILFLLSANPTGEEGQDFDVKDKQYIGKLESIRIKNEMLEEQMKAKD